MGHTDSGRGPDSATVRSGGRNRRGPISALLSVRRAGSIAAILFALDIAVQCSPLAGGLAADALGHGVLVAAVVVAVVAAVQAGDRTLAWPQLARTWRLLGAALVAAAAGELSQLAPAAFAPTAVDILGSLIGLLFYPIAFAAVMAFPTRHRSASDQALRVLDAAIVALGSASVVVYLIIGPGALTGGHGAFVAAVSIAYPVGDLVLLFGVASLLLRGSSSTERAALRLLCGALTLAVVADLIDGYATLHPAHYGTSVVSIISVGAAAIATFAAEAQPRVVGPTLMMTQSRRVSWLPFMAIVLGFGMLIWVDRHDRLFPDLTITLVVLSLAALVSARQLLGQMALARAQDRLRHQALHDALTGRPNRLLIMDRAEVLLARARRERLPVAVLFIDVDGFKHVNDVFGHSAGDVLLRTVADRVALAVRPGDTVGRLGGDEFVVLLDPQDTDAGPENVANRILEALRVPIDLPGPPAHAVTVSASVGIATGVRETAEELFRDADTALYRAKRTGRDRAVRFSPDMHDDEESRLALETGLRSAVEHDEFLLVFQPIVELSSMRTVAVEALIRWDHPRHGILLPGAFIPVAEQAGLISSIGRWALMEAAHRVAEYRRHGSHLSVAVNVSARQFDDPAFIDDVGEALATSGLDPSALTLEVTETAVMSSLDRTVGLITELRSMGVRIAIDDFGTGLCSLAYLRSLPVDALKIDRAFVTDITGSGESTAILRTLIQLGRSLGIEVIAEGVEDASQLAFLVRERCDLAQGFLLSRPTDLAAIHLLELSSPRSWRGSLVVERARSDAPERLASAIALRPGYTHVVVE